MARRSRRSSSSASCRSAPRSVYCLSATAPRCSRTSAAASASSSGATARPGSGSIRTAISSMARSSAAAPRQVRSFSAACGSRSDPWASAERSGGRAAKPISRPTRALPAQRSIWADSTISSPSISNSSRCKPCQGSSPASGLLAPVQREPRSLTDAQVSVEKVRMLARDVGKEVPAFGLLLDQDPPGERPWPVDRGQPDVPIPFMEKVTQSEPGLRRFLHVVTERAHARHDLVARLRGTQARRHARAGGHIRAVPLSFDDHGRGPIERAERYGRQDRGSHGRWCACPAERSSGHADADGLRRHERNHVADAERVPFVERHERGGGRAQKGNRENSGNAAAGRNLGPKANAEARNPAHGETEGNAETGRAKPHEGRAAEHLCAPCDLLHRHPEIASRLVLGNEEPTGDEPFADHDTAEDHEADARDRREKRDGRHAAQGLQQRGAAPPQRPNSESERGCRYGPGLVAREAREGKRDPGRVRPTRFTRL